MPFLHPTTINAIIPLVGLRELARRALIPRVVQPEDEKNAIVAYAVILEQIVNAPRQDYPASLPALLGCSQLVVCRYAEPHSPASSRDSSSSHCSNSLISSAETLTVTRAPIFSCRRNTRYPSSTGLTESIE